MPLVDAKPRQASKQPVVAVRTAGGDNEVKRDGNGRPKILVDCDLCPGNGHPPGRIDGKRAGTTKKCTRCNQPDVEPGKREVSYTRVTTFIDALEDKSTLMTWEGRMVLLGAAMDTGLLKGVLDGDPEDKEVKDMLNRRAEAAKTLAGASRKADEGTLMHGYSELVDEGIELPLDIDLEHFLTLDAYTEATVPLLDIYLMEQLVVCDEYKTAGTPDRISSVKYEGPLVAPDGHVFQPHEKIITDLKTGRIDYGGLKMAMQLSIYSRSKRYMKATGARVEIPNLNTDWGIIMHAPPKGGVCDLYWADLRMGWDAVALAAEVRAMRSQGRHALSPLVPVTEAAEGLESQGSSNLELVGNDAA